MYTLSSVEIDQVAGGFCPCMVTSFTLLVSSLSTGAAAYTANTGMIYGISGLLFSLAGYYGYLAYTMD